MSIILSSVFYTEDAVLCNFGCRNEQVEQIAQQFLNNLPDYRLDANTLLLSIGRFSGLQYFRLETHSPDELVDVCAKIEEFHGQGLCIYRNGR